jgi:uncharacterized protein
MRREDREIKDKGIIEKIITEADVIRIGFFDGHEPYIVPLNFGYKEPYFFMHCANEGRKIEIIKKEQIVCFELDTKHELKTSPQACGWGMTFRSVMGTGKIKIIQDQIEKEKGLAVLMNHYNPTGISQPYDFSKLLQKTTVLKLKVETITCKVKE